MTLSFFSKFSPKSTSTFSFSYFIKKSSNFTSRTYPILKQYPELIWNTDETSTNQNQRLQRAFGGTGLPQPLKLDANSLPNLTMVPFISPGPPYWMPPVFLAPGSLYTKVPHWAPEALENEDPWQYEAGFYKTRSGFMTQESFGKARKLLLYKIKISNIFFFVLDCSIFRRENAPDSRAYCGDYRS